MKTIEEMLRHLARSEVAEFAVASGRLPCVKVDGAYQPVDEDAPTTDAILQMLVGVGGSRYVDALGVKPTQWNTRMEGVGTIQIAAVMRDEKVQARFTLVKKEERPPPRRPSRRPPPTPSPSARATAPTHRPMMPPSQPTEMGLGPAEVRSSAQKEVQHPQIKTIQQMEAAPQPRPRANRRAEEEAEEEEDGFKEEAPTRPAGSSLDLDREAAEAAALTAPKAIDFDLDGPSGAFQAPGVSGKARSSRPASAARPRSTPPPQQGLARKSAPPKRSSSPAASRAAPCVLSFPPLAASYPRDVLLGELLESARQMGASDLLVVSERPPLFRVGGELIARGEPLLARRVLSMLLGEVPKALLPVLESEGSCVFALDLPQGRYRANVSLERTGFKGAFRIISRTVPALESLGLPAELGRATAHHQGLVLIAGPTGHGKTTTLAAIVDLVNRSRPAHIVTVEDPIEHVHPRKVALMSQREVGTHTRSFATALRAALHEDPDVIVVSELRDRETVRTCLAASETGHLVLGTMNAPNVARAVDRLIDLFPPADRPQVRSSLAAGLKLAVSQRLVPKADGKEMVAALEVLPGSTALGALIREDKPLQLESLQQRGRALGLVRLDDSLAELVRAGTIARDAAVALADAPDELEGLVRGPPASATEAAEESGRRPGVLQRAGALFGRKGG